MWFYEVMGNINLTIPNAATFMPSWIGNISIVLKLPKWGQNLSKSIEQCQNDRRSQQGHFNFRLSSSVWCTMSLQDAKKNVSTWYWNSSKQTGKMGGVSEFFKKCLVVFDWLTHYFFLDLAYSVKFANFAVIWLFLQRIPYDPFGVRGLWL